MKKVIIVIGLILTVFSLYNIMPFIADYSRLSEYGKGYFLGNILILFIGIALSYFGLRKKKHNWRETFEVLETSKVLVFIPVAQNRLLLNVAARWLFRYPGQM